MFRKNTPLAFPNNLPPLPHSHTQKWQRKAAELFGRQWQSGVDGNVKALAAAHPWTLAAATAAAAAAAGGGQWRLLCSARVGVRPLTRWLTLCAHGPGQQGVGSSARLLGLRWGQATDAVASTARSQPRASWGRFSSTRGCIRGRLRR